MIFDLDQIQLWISHYKYFIIFPLAVVEGPVIAVISGLMVASGYLGMTVAYLVLVLGDIVGDSIYYFVGRKGARFFVKIFGRFAGVDTDHFIALENHFKKHAGKTIFFSKTQALGGAILAAAGASKMSYWKFLLYNILGSSIKIMALVVLGYYFGKSYNNINNGLNIAGLVSVVILILITVIYLRRKKKKS